MTSTLFPVAGRMSTGYQRAQVDAFFERARAAYERDGVTGAHDGATAGSESSGPAGDEKSSGPAGDEKPSATDEHAADDDAAPTTDHGVAPTTDDHPSDAAHARPAHDEAGSPAADEQSDDARVPMTEHDVRTVAFDLVRSGYATGAVDAALDRLEAAFVQRRRERFIAEYGRQAWMDKIAELATTLYPRLVRPAGERFAPPQSGSGYDRAAVDALMDQLVGYFDTNADLGAAELRTATFPSARGDNAYAEGPVDAYLDRAVEVLLAVE